MKKNIVLLFAALVTLGVLLGWQVPQTAAEQPKTLEFNSMVGVPPALTGTQNPIRGINGGGLPWTIGPSSGELKSDGRLEIEVHGLVFAAGPNTGSNTVPAFRAIVSCLKNDGTVQNVMTAPFPATLGPASQGGGNAEIEATLTLPHPCIAPLIFVTSPGGAWFATIGS
ncbi:MAG TPA: hypothetical protein VF932_13530 [Anaerolineae bacterium]